jgi:methylenetetrahydrofolate dehydrogenase (NADP+)/methenyltetrahydrofolate cyclohydrolase
MKIDGKEIALKIYENLKKKVEELHQKNINPHLAVILIGNNPSSESYVAQKRKWAEYIGATVTIYQYPDDIAHEAIRNKLLQLNQEPTVHAILIQRPVPSQINIQELVNLTDPQKDIDGFHPDSPYTLPLPLAVVKILEDIHQQETANFYEWLRAQSIIIIGKGETAGKPIVNYFTKLNIPFNQIDSKTPNPEELTKTADIIISAVGKDETVKPENIKRGVILIGVGLFKGADGKLHGDYNEETIQDKVSLYTPTPGGVGPVNVAMLMQNLLTATERQTS